MTSKVAHRLCQGLLQGHAPRPLLSGPARSKASSAAALKAEEGFKEGIVESVPATAIPQGVMAPVSSPRVTQVPPHLDFDNARPFSEMPGPQSLPIIGVTWMFMPGGPLHGLTFEQCGMYFRDTYGPVVRVQLLPRTTICNTSLPENFEAVYRSEGSRPFRDGFRILKKYNEVFNNGLQGIITGQGDAWHRLRSKTQVKMLKPKSALAYLDQHNAVATDFTNSLARVMDSDGVIDDLLPELYKFGMEGIGCVCFGRRLGALDADIEVDSDAFRFIRAVNDVMDASQKELKMVFMNIYSRAFRKLYHAQRFIRELSVREAHRTLEMFSSSGKDVDGESGDLIPYLMSKTELTEDEVMTVISEFFFAGVDTTSILLGYSLYQLSLNPEAQEKLVEEIDQTLEGRDNISASALGRMSYLKAVTKETFRMCPVAPGNGRTLQTDIVLSGYHVPAGVMVAIQHDLAGKDETYVKHADRFLPERWFRGNQSDIADIHPFVLMPFGFGPRSCVGRRFAEQEYSLGLIKILQKYRVEYALDKKLAYDMCLINKPTTPLKFRFIPRQ